MKKNFVLIQILMISFVSQLTFADFDLDDYYQYLRLNQNMTADDLYQRYPLPQDYYKSTNDTFLTTYQFLDSIQYYYELTEDEISLLKENHFMVTERLNPDGFAQAFHDIYAKDLPLFLSTDFILYSLHSTYDKLLIAFEIQLLEPKLIETLETMYHGLEEYINQIPQDQIKTESVNDLDLYLTIAYSLSQGELKNSILGNDSATRQLWEQIEDEQPKKLSLFSEHQRLVDFSQFKPRGHYTHEIYWYEMRTLEKYFKTMMWLGRIDLFLTPPPVEPNEEEWSMEDLQRMNLDVFMLQELAKYTNVWENIELIDSVLVFFIGDSDNLTPSEYQEFINENSFQAADISNDSLFENYYSTISNYEQGDQKILSNLFMVDPLSSSPEPLPKSWKLFGQRFVLDSYIFSNIVYDRIIYEGEKIFRGMPDPLDVAFILGNNDAGFLIEEQLNLYHYSSAADALRFLVESYEDDFWNSSLYNVWLNSIRTLNTKEQTDQFPYFMKTNAWHQQKINTQLASWSQLRHDNLLYAKQSYTGMTACSYPHTFIEPYPELYQNLANFAIQAKMFTQPFNLKNIYTFQEIQFFDQFIETMLFLKTLAEKELRGENFNQTEIDSLQKMLFLDGGSGKPPFSGWITHFFFNPYDVDSCDYPVADVHTQPTDAFGNMIGHVLHVGTGNINLGVFLVKNSPSSDQPVAYIGPCMSYYEQIEKDFYRLTDHEWQQKMQSGEAPARPDWVNIYLADSAGNRLPQGRELEGIHSTQTAIRQNPDKHLHSKQLDLNCYPNPFNQSIHIHYKSQSLSNATIKIFNITGELIRKINQNFNSSQQIYTWDGKDQFNHLVASGIYFVQVKTNKKTITKKISFIQ